MQVRENEDQLIVLAPPKEVEWFTLKNNGDYAFVRFMYDINEPIYKTTIHKVKQTGFKSGTQYDASINCLYNGEPGSCPLCEAGYKQYTQIYVKVSKVQPDGTEKFMIWAQKPAYLETLTTLIDRYPNGLYKTVWQLKRIGEAGKSATYDRFEEATQVDITLDDLPKIVDPIGTLVRDYNYEELSQFIRTGNFPQRNNDNSNNNYNNNSNSNHQQNPYTNIPKLPKLQVANKTKDNSF